MVLADTSVWVEHLRKGDLMLEQFLLDANVLIHPFIVGELACGNLKRRASILADLNALPGVKAASDHEVLQLIDDRSLWGQGIGWIDSHLLASALISSCQFWTLDRRLDRMARSVGIKTLST